MPIIIIIGKNIRKGMDNVSIIGIRKIIIPILNMPNIILSNKELTVIATLSKIKNKIIPIITSTISHPI